MISILCPSRGRPDRFKIMVETAAATMRGSYEIIAVLDGDDECLGEYFGCPNVRYIIGERKNICEKNTLASKEAHGDMIWVACDCTRFRGIGWDLLAEQHVPEDGIYVLRVKQNEDNGHWGLTVSPKMIEVLGYFMHPFFEHTYCDTWLIDVAERAGRLILCDDIMHYHDHPSRGTMLEDDTFRHQCRDNYSHIEKSKKYYDENVEERIDAAEMLKQYIHDVEHEKVQEGEG